MKLASYYRSHGCRVKLVRGETSKIDFIADQIEITSLFTYAWLPVHKAIEYYHRLFPEAKITVGGLYATILPDHIKSKYPFVKIHSGLHDGAERYMPAYDILKQTDKWKTWNKSILFTSRGCIRKCPFCIVPKLEGEIRTVITDVQDFIYTGHNEVILWDNNFFASPKWKTTLNNLIETGIKIDFNQGLDARLIDEEKAALLADMKMPVIRMAYDWEGEGKIIERTVNLLKYNGIRKRDILFYALYNFYDGKGLYGDTPEVFFKIIKHILSLGCVVYPMRFEPLDSLKKNDFISPLWTGKQLEAVAEARRVIGYGGSFPPYQALINKFQTAFCFDEAFELRPDINRIKKTVIDESGSPLRSASESGIRASGSPARC
jgi:hypothetical protein